MVINVRLRNAVLCLLLPVAAGAAGGGPAQAPARPAQAASGVFPTKDYASELRRIPIKDPIESQRAIVAMPGFRVELVASEPLIGSPVAIDFDEHGRLYVAEFPEYNQYAAGDSRPAG